MLIPGATLAAARPITSGLPLVEIIEGRQILSRIDSFCDGLARMRLPASRPRRDSAAVFESDPGTSRGPQSRICFGGAACQVRFHLDPAAPVLRWLRTFVGSPFARHCRSFRASRQEIYDAIDVPVRHLHIGTYNAKTGQAATPCRMRGCDADDLRDECRVSVIVDRQSSTITNTQKIGLSCLTHTGPESGSWKTTGPTSSLKLRSRFS